MAKRPNEPKGRMGEKAEFSKGRISLRSNKSKEEIFQRDLFEGLITNKLRNGDI